MNNIPDNPYLLLTPGPLSTTKSVKAAMLKDWCTWDKDYNDIVQDIRRELVEIATAEPEPYTSVLMQGSGTFCVESVIGSAIPKEGKLLVLANGAYGQRIAKIAHTLGIACCVQDSGETAPIDIILLIKNLEADQSITHVAVVHCETTTGMLNNVMEIGKIVKSYGKTFILDAMSSFGGIPMDVAQIGADFMISSANKCIQGVPGFGFIIAKRAELLKCKGKARSLSLDLFDQWDTMEKGGGKWRYTSPTHVVRAFYEALHELKTEGIANRYIRYSSNQKLLLEGMKKLGFRALLQKENQSPIITSFHYPNEDFSFEKLYHALKDKGFIIYPGKISEADTFRIGNIGEVHKEDIVKLLSAIEEYKG